MLQLPQHVVAFLTSHVDHPVKLDFVVFLHRAAATMPVWIAASSLDVPKRQIRDMAQELADDGLVRVSGDRLELAPSSADDHRAIIDLATLYTLDRAPVLAVLESLGRA